MCTDTGAQRITPALFWILNSGFWILAVALVPASVLAQTRLRVEFTERADCSVTANGPASRSHVRYPRVTPEWRCAVTGLREAGAVDLEVLAPPGAGRPASSFPQLRWAAEGERWVGRARLPAAPAFVRLLPSGSRAGRSLDAAVALAVAAAVAWALAIGRRDGGSTSLRARPS